MAKRKLDKSQRTAIRKEISTKLSAGVRQSELLQSIAKEYSISTESVRWYLKDVRKAGRSRPRKANGRAALHGAGRAPKRRRAPTHVSKASSNGHGKSLLELVRNVSANALRRALEAKKLLPTLESLRKRYANLEQVKRAVHASLGALAGRLKSLERRIARLTAR
jgi:hypothetical protein